MAAPPGWGFDDLAPATRAVLAHALPTRIAPVRAPLPTAEWVALRTAAAAHGLQGVLVGAVVDGALPTSAAQRAESARVEVELTDRRMAHEVRSARWLEVLADAGIDVIVLKGPALAALDYPDLQWRPTSDLDLLVRADQIVATVRVLVAAGGSWVDPEPTDHYVEVAGKGATVAMPDGLEVDLHRILVWGPFGVRVPAEELWDDPGSFSFGGADRHALRFEARLLHLAAHLLVLGSVKAREVRDVAQLLCSPELDPDRVLPLARRWGQEAVLATAVCMADRELLLRPEANPLSAWAAGYPVRLRDRVWLRTEQPVGRWHGLESPAVYLELGDRGARQVLRRATMHPAAGTWASPGERLRVLRRRVVGRSGM